MAAKRIPQLDPLSAVAVDNNDSLVIFDQSTDTTKRVLRSNLLANTDGASLVGVNPTGDVSSTTVQAAIAELDSEKIGLSRLAASDGSSLVGYTQGGGGGYDLRSTSYGNGGSGIIFLRIPNVYTATFSAGVTHTLHTPAGYNVYEVTAAGASDTVTFN